MFFTADTSLPFSDITDALRKGFNMIVVASDVSANIAPRANGENPEFINFVNKMKDSNSSLVKTIEDGIRLNFKIYIIIIANILCYSEIITN